MPLLGWPSTEKGNDIFGGKAEKNYVTCCMLQKTKQVVILVVCDESQRFLWAFLVWSNHKKVFLSVDARFTAEAVKPFFFDSRWGSQTSLLI